jgi:hypothetical protein
MCTFTLHSEYWAYDAAHIVPLKPPYRLRFRYGDQATWAKRIEELWLKNSNEPIPMFLLNAASNGLLLHRRLHRLYDTAFTTKRGVENNHIHFAVQTSIIDKQVTDTSIVLVSSELGDVKDFFRKDDYIPIIMKENKTDILPAKLYPLGGERITWVEIADDVLKEIKRLADCGQ